jgi:hypothetical protein
MRQAAVVNKAPSISQLTFPKFVGLWMEVVTSVFQLELMLKYEKQQWKLLVRHDTFILFYQLHSKFVLKVTMLVVSSLWTF